MRSQFLLTIPFPGPVDAISYEQYGEIETMILRAGDKMIRQPYTFTDCFVTVYAPRHSPFGAGRPLRSLDSARLEEKRRQNFKAAYDALMREALAGDAE